MMIDPITDGIDNTDHQMMLTVNDIRESDRARTTSMINQSIMVASPVSTFSGDSELDD